MRPSSITCLVKNPVSILTQAFLSAPRTILRTVALAVLISSTCAVAQTLTTLYSFGSNAGDGADPQSGLVLDKNGNLYGTASVGGISGANGIVFELAPPAVPGDPWTETALHRFQGKPDGKVPEGRLLLSSTGNLFGTTLNGGANDMGTVFISHPPVNPGGAWAERVIYSFGSFPGDGVNPNHGLLAAHPGLYGVTSGGGTSNKGTVFQLTPPTAPGGAWTETILYSFKGSGDAAFPSGELVMDKNGNLYGTTLLGGTNNLGAVYELSPPTAPGNPWTETVLHSFNGTDGTLPGGRLLLDASGTVYGTTSGGGSKSAGTGFTLLPPINPGDPWTESVLYNFSGGSADGGSPDAGVVMDAKGRLYGTAANGGQHGGGVVFVLNPPANGGGWSEVVLYSFSGPDGYAPNSPVTLSKGKIFGMTSQGGAFGTGTIFVLTP